MTIFLGQNIKYLRDTKLRVSKTKLGDLIDINNGTVGKYENNTARPSFEVLIKLSEIFATDLHSLVFVNLEDGEGPGVKEPAPEYKIDLKEDLCRLWNRLEELEGRVGKLEGDGKKA